MQDKNNGINITDRRKKSQLNCICGTFFCIFLFRILALSFLAFALALITNGFVIKPAMKFESHYKQFQNSLW